MYYFKLCAEKPRCFPVLQSKYNMGYQWVLHLFTPQQFTLTQLKCTFQMFNQAVGRLETAREVATWGKSVSSKKKRGLLRHLHTARGARVACVDLSTHIGKSLYQPHCANVNIIFSPNFDISEKVPTHNIGFSLKIQYNKSPPDCRATWVFWALLVWASEETARPWRLPRAFLLREDWAVCAWAPKIRWSGPTPGHHGLIWPWIKPNHIITEVGDWSPSPRFKLSMETNLRMGWFPM